MHALRLRGVVVVEAGGRAGNVDDVDAGEHAEPLDEVDRRRHATGDAVRLVEARQRGLDALAPQPDLRRGRSRRRSRPRRDDGARRVHQREQLRRGAGRSGTPPACPVRSWGGVHSASAQSHGTTQRWRYSTPGWKRTPSRPLPSAASSAATIGGSARSSGGPPRSRPSSAGRRRDSVTRLQRYATSSGRELDTHRGRLDRRAAGVVLARDRTRGSPCCRRRSRAAARTGSPRRGRLRRGRPVARGAACARLRAACGRRARRAGRRHTRRARTPGTSRRRRLSYACGFDLGRRPRLAPPASGSRP